MIWLPFQRENPLGLPAASPLNALKALWKYYEDFVDYQPGEEGQANRRRKQRLWQWYRDNNFEEDFSLDLSRLNHTVAALLSEYYEPEEGRLSYESLINRMSFWMATGSGKTLVIVKLIELLARLIRRNSASLRHPLPDPPTTLIEQLKRHVKSLTGIGVTSHRLRNLKEYSTVKRETPSLFHEQEVTIFITAQITKRRAEREDRGLP